MPQLHRQTPLPDMTAVFRMIKKRREYQYDPVQFRALVPSLGDFMRHSKFLLTVHLSGGFLSTWEGQSRPKAGVWHALKMKYRGWRLIRTTNEVPGSVFHQLYDAWSKGKEVTLTWFRVGWREQKTKFVPVTSTPKPTPQPQKP